MTTLFMIGGFLVVVSGDLNKFSREDYLASYLISLFGLLLILSAVTYKTFS